MISQEQTRQIRSIWDAYNATKTAGHRTDEIPDLDNKRMAAIKDIKRMLDDFIKDKTDVHAFKSLLDGYNKRNNLWGFTAVKGQMFFNQLVRSYEGNIGQFTTLLKSLITEPMNLADALERIQKLEKPTAEQFQKAKDKRKAANPGSTGYFLSYFWQIHNPEKWPILYTSLINAFVELGIWQKHTSQSEDYQYFFELNEEIKKVLSGHAGHPISNWDAEHAFWNYKGNPNAKLISTPITERAAPITVKPLPDIDEEIKPALKASFDVYDYIIPKLSRLLDIGAQADKPSSTKGQEFERLVADAFRHLGFDVETLGQGKGRNPDAIARFKEDHTAFMIDAKAYNGGYVMGTDDRAIREYINHHCPILQRDGCRKIGFIIVSNSFRGNFDDFISDITWNTDIKRFMLLSTEALLYLLAYKMKDNLPLNVLVERLIGCGSLIDAKSVIEEFDDV